MMILQFRLIALLLIILPFTLTVQGQDKEGYQIEVNIDDLSNSDLYLGFHYGNRQLIKDTIGLDQNGQGVFRGNTNLDQGIYLVITPGKKYFEMLVGRDQHFSLSASKGNLVHSLEFEGSEINTVFNDYQRFMMNQTRKKNALQKKISSEGGSQDSTKVWKEQLQEVNREVEAKWDHIMTEHQGTLLAAVIRAMKNPEVPDIKAPESAPNKDSLTWASRYSYYKAHYFDNLDLSDPRLVRTPIFHNKLEHYFNNIVEQHPDSINKRIDWVVKQTRGSDENFQYAVRYLLNHYQKSNIMGMDKVFVHVAEKYYLSGKADWVDEATMAKIKDRVMRIKPNLIGKQAPHLSLTSTNGKNRDLYEVQSQYTLLYFYEPTCSHCKKVTPKVYELYQKYNRDQFEVYAIYTQSDRQEWKQYINNNNLDWINVYDPRYSSNFREKYDVYSTPTIYLLDEDKNIVAKRIGHDTLKEMLKQKLGE